MCGVCAVIHYIHDKLLKPLHKTFFVDDALADTLVSPAELCGIMACAPPVDFQQVHVSVSLHFTAARSLTADDAVSLLYPTIGYSVTVYCMHFVVYFSALGPPVAITQRASPYALLLFLSFFSAQDLRGLSAAKLCHTIRNGCNFKN